MGAVPLIHGLRSRFPGARIVLSTLTPTGRQVGRQYCGDIEVVRYGLVDFLLIPDRVISQIRPTIFLPVESDIWPMLIRRLWRRGVPCVLVNGRVSHRRVRYRFLFKSVFRRITFFSVQTEVDAERLLMLGVSRGKIAVTGNTKFSQAARGAVDAKTKSIPLPEGSHLLIGGSTHDEEEAELLHCYTRLAARRKNIFLLLAPRHLERLERVERLVISQGFAYLRWSEMGSEIRAPIIILDTMGRLPEIYGQASMVFVGGSWVKRGGHNVMEPAAWGKPLFFGPYMDNYSSIAAALVRSGAAVEVRNGEELAIQIEDLLDHAEKLAEMGRLAKGLVESNQDAVARNLDVVENVLVATGKLNRHAAEPVQSGASEPPQVAS
jgi:3-deoxy-D-manno-octulosonic-acid transferase